MRNSAFCDWIWTITPDNPNAWVMAATELIRFGYNEDDLQKVIAGKVLLERAKTAYETHDNTHITTYWARDFVNFWLNFADRLIKSPDGRS